MFREERLQCGQVPEWPKGADCKSAVTDFDGSNPSLSTTFSAGMAELADALDSGSSESNFMQVQVLFPAPNQYNPSPVFTIGNGFGFFLSFNSISIFSLPNAAVPKNRLAHEKHAWQRH